MSSFGVRSLQIDGLTGYDRALVLLRYGGRPIGQISVPVIDGRINRTEMHDLTLHTDHWPIWLRMVYEYLDWNPQETPHFHPKATVAVITHDRPEDL